MCAATGSENGPSARRRWLVLAALAAVLALAGCGFLPYEEAESPELPAGEEAAQQYRSLDGYQATIVYEYSDRENRRAQVAVDLRSGRSRFAWRAPESVAGNLVVYNGSTVVRYNATTNEYSRVSTLNLDRVGDNADRIEQLVDAARREGEMTVEAPPPGGAPLPAVPQGNQSTDAETDSRFAVSYEGTETVAGREAHVIDYESVDDPEEGVVEQTVWLDTEHFVTLRSTQRSVIDGSESTVTFRLENLTFDPDFSAARFEFDPPPGATLDTASSYDLTSYETRAELAAEAEMTVPDPAVPDPFVLTRADEVRGENSTTVQLRYQSTGSVLYVTKTATDDFSSLDEGERVTVGDQPGSYRASATRALVVWQCGEYEYTVVGDLPKSDLLSVADSVACA